MTVESLRLRNFQCHEDLLIELDPRVTSIVGPSDCGKSATIRALRWAALNIPVGCMIRDGAKQVSVEVVVDGRRIVRSRGSENSYSFDGKEFRAFRSDVPSEILELLNLTEANFQGQYDPLYWFSSTAGDVSRQLNAVVNLDLIDRTLSWASREVNRRKVLLEHAEQNLSASVAERDELKWVADADGDLKKVEWSESSLADIREDASDLESRISLVQEARGDAERSRSLADDSERLLCTMGAYGKASQAFEKLNRLKWDASIKEVDAWESRRLAGDSEMLLVAAGNRDRVVREVFELERIVGAVRESHARRSEEVPDICKLGTLADLFKDCREKFRSLKKLLDEARDADDNKAEAEKVFCKALNELEAKSEGRCPLCGGELRECLGR